MKRNMIGMTIGDPAGVGPEIVLKCLLNFDLWDELSPVVIGDALILKEAARQYNIDVSFYSWTPGQGPALDLDRRIFPVYDTHTGYNPPAMGRASFEGGKISLASLLAATRLALANEIDAIVTAPICKESFSLAGCHSNGHTDLLANLCNVTDYAMMLAAKDLQVVHVTTHLSLADACRKLNRDMILQKIRLAAEAANHLHPFHPTVAVCGLNPHSGENGLMGREEMELIIPAIHEARAEGLSVLGPFPSDTVFLRALNGEFNTVLAMYHDQGHIPVKLLGFMDGVNVTLGLPFVRTSVDHGTAFGKAGKGTADPGSLIAAVKMAARLVDMPDYKLKLALN